MKQVFISYSSRDFNQAQAVRNVLEQNGITCWMAPADIPGGSNYTKEIPLAIRGCQAFVLMLSDNAQKSHWVLKELDAAVNAGKIILPFQLEDVPLRDEFNFLLTGAQRYDAYRRKSEAMNLLVTRIKAIINAGAPEAPQQEMPQENVPAPEQKPKIKPLSIPVIPKKEPERTRAADTGVTCPACGGSSVVEFPNQTPPYGFGELVYRYVMSVVSVLAGGIVGMVPWIILIMFDFSDDFLVVFLVGVIAGFILGGWYGNRLIQQNLRNFHIRKHIEVKACRCNTCQKKFQAVINLK